MTFTIKKANHGYDVWYGTQHIEWCFTLWGAKRVAKRFANEQQQTITFEVDV
jgi:hypothetical protein